MFRNVTCVARIFNIMFCIMYHTYCIHWLLSNAQFSAQDRHETVDTLHHLLCSTWIQWWVSYRNLTVIYLYSFPFYNNVIIVTNVQMTITLLHARTFVHTCLRAWMCECYHYRGYDTFENRDSNILYITDPFYRQCIVCFLNSIYLIK